MVQSRQPLPPVRDLKDLLACQIAMDLAEAVHRSTARFPASEQYGLAFQIRRAATSVPSNLAEGHGRGGRARTRISSPSPAAH